MAGNNTENKAATDSEAKPKPMTNAQAAALVKRDVPTFKDGKPTGKTKKVSINADEVMSFREYDTYVTVVTIDGQKYRGEKK